MADIGVTIDANSVLRQLGRLGTVSNPANVDQVLGEAAELVLAKARKRAPFQFGPLRDSDFVSPARALRKGRGVTFGFNKEYAAVMNFGWKVSVIRPVRAKALFIPISRRAARKGVGAIDRMEPGKDFIFVKHVIPRKVRRFAERGPNLYFSGTLKEFQREASPSLLLLALAKGFDFLLQKIEKFTGVKQVKPVRRRRA